MVRSRERRKRLEYLHHLVVIVLTVVALWLLFTFTATYLRGLPWPSVVP